MSAIRGVNKFIPFEKPTETKAKADTAESEFSIEESGEPTANRTENQKVREVADLYEKFFIKELMRHMKSGLNEDSGIIKKNNAEKIFSEQLDEQYSEEWNKRGGFGMSDMIYDNITQRYGESIGSEVKKDGLAQVQTEKMVKPDDLSHEQMLWQIEMNQKDIKK